jgi:hypothetical protein
MKDLNFFQKCCKFHGIGIFNNESLGGKKKSTSFVLTKSKVEI